MGALSRSTATDMMPDHVLGLWLSKSDGSKLQRARTTAKGWFVEIDAAFHLEIGKPAPRGSIRFTVFSAGLIVTLRLQ